MRILNTLIIICTRLRGVCVTNKINYNTLCSTPKQRINAFGRPWDTIRESTPTGARSRMIVTNTALGECGRYVPVLN